MSITAQRTKTPYGICIECQTPFLKPKAKFCSKCGVKRTFRPPPVASSGVESSLSSTTFVSAELPKATETGPSTKGTGCTHPLSSPMRQSAPLSMTAKHVVARQKASDAGDSSSAYGSAARASVIEKFSSTVPHTYSSALEAMGRSEKRMSESCMGSQCLSVDLRRSSGSSDDIGVETVKCDDVDEMVYSNALATLGPDGITPEMLQTSNAEVLKQFKKGPLLGRGTYGSVYLGLLSDGSFYAVKQVELGGKTGNISAKELVALSREINIMRRLQHRNLCSFKGAFFDANNGCINMFMEYVSGGSLTNIVKKFKPLPPSVIRMWTKQLLAGLYALHSNLICHRDIKGENILIDTSPAPSVVVAPTTTLRSTKHNAAEGNAGDAREGSPKIKPAPPSQVKLVDFGAAKRLTDAVAQSRTVIGTPYWMAPEIVDIANEGTGYSYKADVWSVGCTLAEMITGKPPWPQKANVPAAIMMIAQCTGYPTEMPGEADGATPGCVDFMKKCFTRNPDERPTVEELLEHPWIKGTMN